MSINKLLIVTAEPKSVFLEILFKYLNSKNKLIKKKKIILVGNKKIVEKEAKINNYKKKIYQINDLGSAIEDKLNIINVEIKKKNYKNYISESFKKSISILQKDKKIGLINGPVDKKTFLNNRYLGVTEYLAKKTGSKKPVMLIYNKKISVSPITTHLPIKYVSKHLNKNKIINNVRSINNFYKKIFKKKPKIAVLGLNPHCETASKISEEKKIIIPAIRRANRMKISTHGPLPCDTSFITAYKNKKYNCLVGMYHDAIQSGLKSFGFQKGVTVQGGLPIPITTPAHGTAFDIVGKNKANINPTLESLKLLLRLLS